ncbi:MAG: RNA-binding S4 domain-containing protein [Erysipelotrichaceae bacterium]
MKINKKFITLSQLLKMEDYVSSGGMVKHVINDFDITVNGEDEHRRGKKLYPGDLIIINGNKIMIEKE